MAAAIAPSSSWLQDHGSHQERMATTSDTHPKQRSSGKREKVRFSRQLHRLTKVLFPSPFGSRPTSQIRGSSRYQCPSPFLKDGVTEDVNTPEEQSEIPEGATQFDVQSESSRPASRASSPSSSMWGPPVAFLNVSRQSHSSSRPTSQGVQARREVKVTGTPPTSEQPQSAIFEKMPPTTLNDKEPLLVDTRALEDDKNSEVEDTAAKEAALIRSLNPFSSDESPVINFSRPLQFLGVNQDNIYFQSASSYGSNTRYLSSCGWLQSSDCSPDKARATEKCRLPAPRQTYAALDSDDSCVSLVVGSSTTINTREAFLLQRAAISDSQNRTGYDAWTPRTSQRVLPPSSSPSALGSTLPGDAPSPPSPLTYSEVVAVNEGRPQETRYPRRDSIS
ncbi:hypothetical protein B0T20DRAFT_492773, partial [Sordaria brevicollis]